MKIDPFLKCLGATGIDTGVSILGVYSMNSGNNLVVWNQLYTTGSNYSNGSPYHAALPLIYNYISTQPSGVFPGGGFYQVGTGLSGDFSALISINYSGCQDSQAIYHRVIASTVNSVATSTSGVQIAITPSKRLCLIAPNYAHTISREIGPSDFAYLNVTSNRFVDFGLFSVADNKFYGKSYDAGSPSIHVKDLVFGNLMQEYLSNLIGYSGKINDVYLFSGRLNFDKIPSCVECTYATGYTNAVNSFTFRETTITNSSWSGVTASGVTGTQKATVNIARKGGGTQAVTYDSGVGGLITLYSGLILATQQSTGTGYFTGLNFSFDNSTRVSNSTSDLFFDYPLVSGDVVEIYTYSAFNTNVNIDVLNLQFPKSNSEIQLFGNGLAETKDVDYKVTFNNLISGFTESDYLLADAVSPTFTMEYQVGTNFVRTGLSNTTQFRITGAKDVNFAFPFQYDIYLNGQKMVSGYDYTVTQTGSNSIILADKNAVYDLSFFDINSGQEIKFVPLPNATPQRYSISGTQHIISGVTGFSEQVWVNGLRQKKEIDYTSVQRCRTCTGHYLEPNYSFSIYNGSTENGVVVPAFTDIGWEELHPLTEGTILNHDPVGKYIEAEADGPILIATSPLIKKGQFIQGEVYLLSSFADEADNVWGFVLVNGIGNVISVPVFGEGYYEGNLILPETRATEDCYLAFVSYPSVYVYAVAQLISVKIY